MCILKTPVYGGYLHFTAFTFWEGGKIPRMTDDEKARSQFWSNVDFRVGV
jgi:hypothetical protein